MPKSRCFAVAIVALVMGAAVAGAATNHHRVAASTRWWWTQDYAAERAALRWGGDAPYWNIGCAGIGSHRYFDIAAKAVGPDGQKVGIGVASSTWKWQHFRCLGLYRNGWTAFELYVLGDFSFKIAPPRGTRYVVTKSIVFR